MTDRQAEDGESGGRPMLHDSQPPRGSFWRRAAIVLVIAAALGALVWYLRPQGTANHSHRGRFSTNGAVPVVAATVQKGDIGVTVDGLGTVTPLQTVTIRTQINGQLMQLGFSEGQIVHKGDFLAQIDPRPYQVALEQAQGQLARDQAFLSEAQIDLKRYERLGKQDSIAQQQVEDQQYVVRQYEGSVKSDQASIDSAKLNLLYCHITSPVTGLVGLRQVDPGNYVQTSDANGIVVVTELQPISVIFPLPEDNVPEIMSQLRAGATLMVTAYDRSMTTKLAIGMLAATDSQINTSTGTLNFRADFDNKDATLFPNQFVNVELLIKELHGAIIAPASAIQRGAPGTFVYLVKPDHTVTVRKVTLGPSEGERVAITAGLEPGDMVVVEGADKLREGSKITIPAPKATNAAPGAAAPAPTPATKSKPQ